MGSKNNNRDGLSQSRYDALEFQRIETTSVLTRYRAWATLAISGDYAGVARKATSSHVSVQQKNLLDAYEGLFDNPSTGRKRRSELAKIVQAAEIVGAMCDVVESCMCTTKPMCRPPLNNVVDRFLGESITAARNTSPGGKIVLVFDGDLLEQVWSDAVTKTVDARERAEKAKLDAARAARDQKKADALAAQEKAQADADADIAGALGEAELTKPATVPPVEVEPNPVEPNPVEPNPVEPNPVEPNPVEPMELRERVEHDPVTPDDIRRELATMANRIESWINDIAERQAAGFRPERGKVYDLAPHRAAFKRIKDVLAGLDFPPALIDEPKVTLKVSKPKISASKS